jgi:hypothetical protein
MSSSSDDEPVVGRTVSADVSAAALRRTRSAAGQHSAPPSREPSAEPGRRAGGAKGQRPHSRLSSGGGGQQKQQGKQRSGQKAGKKAEPQLDSEPPQANTTEVPFTPEELVGWVLSAAARICEGPTLAPRGSGCVSQTCDDVLPPPPSHAGGWWACGGGLTTTTLRASSTRQAAAWVLLTAHDGGLMPRRAQPALTRAPACPKPLPHPSRACLQGKVKKYLKEKGQHFLEYPDEEVSAAAWRQKPVLPRAGMLCTRQSAHSPAPHSSPGMA